MVLSKLLNLFFISTSSTLYAQNCLPVYSGPVQKIIVSTPRTCQLAQNMAEELRQVSLEIKRDAKVTLVIGPPSDNAGFDDGHLIEIPERFVRFNRYNNANPGDSRQPQIAVVHEYGHAIFLELLKKEFSKNFHDLFEKLEQSSKESEDFLTLGSSPKEQFNNLLQSDKYRLYSEIFNAYSELYADTVAIYYLNDPKIMFHGLYFEGLSDREYNFIQLRDFSIQHKLKSIEPFNSVHAKLALVRSFIGKNMLPKLKSDKNKLLAILEKALLSAARSDLKNGLSPSIREANENVIRALKSELKSKY